MYPFFESIKINDGKIYHWDLHLDRMQSTLFHHFGTKINSELFQPILKCIPKTGLYKLRLMYNAVNFTIEYIKYSPKKINKLIVVYDDNINYEYKYIDRTALLKHTASLANDEDIILIKNDLITDTTYSNLAFYNGQQWHTPSRPLLRGVQRKYLIDAGVLLERNISLGELSGYTKTCLINAMLDLNDLCMEVSAIK